MEDYARLFNEMFTEERGVRPHYAAFAEWLEQTPAARVAQNRHAAELLFHRVGITFAVYGEASGTERLIPFDIVPHVIPGEGWERLARGLRQRIKALNRFLHDVYHGQEIVRAGKIPIERIAGNAQFRKEMVGVDVPRGVYAHVAGVDLVRHSDGEHYVLEDNLRTPSGVSYMLENRKMMMRLFPELFANQSIRPVDHYPDLLLETLRAVAPRHADNPVIVLLTPGHYNSAYFEHAFLAQQMGIELVEGQDLFVQNETVFMRTTQGPQRVDVVYRRIDDDFLDPEAFRPDTMLGVPGLLGAYRAGRVTLANAEDLKFVLANLDTLVVKETQGSGGYGMLVGPTASRDERERYRLRILDGPERFIAQPTLALSCVPTFCGDALADRHVDLRPYVLTGSDVAFVPGGLTRVAIREGSLVVNSSQGGGVKDTWVVD